MNLLSLENLTQAFSERVLFENADFFLQTGDKVGVIGINGTGKSTLLKIAAGLVEPDAGKRTKANHAVLQYLPQTPEFNGEDRVLAHAMREVSASANWDMEGEVKNMLLSLGISEWEQRIGELSGGQRKRLALAEVLLKPCDILILDEPTNHLDHAMAAWLENYLKQWRGSLIMVTHDRYFLDSVSNRIVEIDKGKIYSYQTNYEGFLELKMQREEMELATERKRQSLLRVELEWVKRGARARSTKQKARLERYEDLKNRRGPQTDAQVELGSISTRMGNTTIEVEGLCKFYGERCLIRDFSYIFLKNDRIGIVGSNGCGKTTLMKMLIGQIEPDAGSIKIGQTIRIGYYSQEIRMVSTREKARIENKSERIAAMDPEERVIDYVRDTAEYVRTADGLISASAMLERFLFPPEEQYGRIGNLSGGERRRLNLLRVLMEAPNVLILDEPTNDLDISTLAILEDYLDHYQGIVISVSHDRYFLDRTVNRIFAFEEGGILKQYEGGYTDYVQKAGEKAQAGLKVQAQSGMKADQPGLSAGTVKNGGFGGLETFSAEDTVSAASDSPLLSAKEAYKASRVKKLKFTFKEQREYDTIESDIEQLEERITSLEEEMVQSARDFVKLGELTKQKEEAEQQLEEKMERWEYLEDLAARIKEQD